MAETRLYYFPVRYCFHLELCRTASLLSTPGAQSTVAWQRCGTHPIDISGGPLWAWPAAGASNPVSEEMASKNNRSVITEKWVGCWGRGNSSFDQVSGSLLRGGIFWGEGSSARPQGEGMASPGWERGHRGHRGRGRRGRDRQRHRDIEASGPRRGLGEPWGLL